MLIPLEQVLCRIKWHPYGKYSQFQWRRHRAQMCLWETKQALASTWKFGFGRASERQSVTFNILFGLVFRDIFIKFDTVLLRNGTRGMKCIAFAIKRHLHVKSACVNSKSELHLTSSGRLWLWFKCIHTGCTYYLKATHTFHSWSYMAEATIYLPVFLWLFPGKYEIGYLYIVLSGFKVHPAVSSPAFSANTMQYCLLCSYRSTLLLYSIKEITHNLIWLKTR